MYGSCNRTESVAEKMLTNWFTFLLYKFLKVSPSHVVLVGKSAKITVYAALFTTLFNFFLKI